MRANMDGGTCAVIVIAKALQDIGYMIAALFREASPLRSPCDSERYKRPLRSCLNQHAEGRVCESVQAFV